MKISDYARRCAQKDADTIGRWPHLAGVAIVPNSNPHRHADWQVEAFSKADGAPQHAIELFYPKPASDLTPDGEQYVIPGTERALDAGPDQLTLWGRKD